MKTTLAALARDLAKTEVRLEVVLEDLIERGILDLDALTVLPQGLFARAYNQDILDAAWNEANALLEVRVCREGLYDLLPKTLFHPPKTTSTSSNPEDQTALIEQTAREEQEARQFFLPFEQAIFRQRIAVESEERELIAGFGNPVHEALFTEFFGTINFLTSYQREILFCLLPLFSRITGDAKMTALSFAALLGSPVRIEPQPDGVATLNAAGLPDLANAQMGIDLLLGDGDLCEQAPHWSIAIGPVDAATLPKYLPGGDYDQLIALLSRYILPAELDYSVEIIPEASVGILNLTAAPHAGRLGFSAVVSSEARTMK